MNWLYGVSALLLLKPVWYVSTSTLSSVFYIYNTLHGQTKANTDMDDLLITTDIVCKMVKSQRLIDDQTSPSALVLMAIHDLKQSMDQINHHIVNNDIKLLTSWITIFNHRFDDLIKILTVYK